MKIKGVVERYKLKVERVRGLVCLVDVCFLVFQDFFLEYFVRLLVVQQFCFSFSLRLGFIVSI